MGTFVPSAVLHRQHTVLTSIYESATNSRFCPDDWGTLVTAVCTYLSGGFLWGGASTLWRGEGDVIHLVESVPYVPVAG